MTVRDALNSAMDEEMARDPDVFILGEEVRPPGRSNTAQNLSWHRCQPRRLAAQVGEYQGAYKVWSVLL